MRFEISAGDKVTFMDKTGEQLSGFVKALEFDGNPDLARVRCYKHSWNQHVNCIVNKDSLTVLK